MKSLVATIALLIATPSWLLAAPPGTLDGENIPADFANSKKVGLQTNYTAVGDVTATTSTPVVSQGSELDALYLAVDNVNLYIGLAGNLVQVGSPFIVLMDTPGDFDLGQTELKTEGVGGPAFMLQLAGREVVVNDNGTPNDTTDDTYTVVPNSGTLLPDCGDPMFSGWDYALAFDASPGGTLDVHEYRLFDFQIGTANEANECVFDPAIGRVSCDPTPDNPNDPPLPIFASRTLIASTPINDGNETIENTFPGGPVRGGMDNTNVLGVTDTDATNAATATKGIEIAIPLGTIGNVQVNPNDVIRMLVITMDGDELQETAVSDGYGTIVNQALPSYTGPNCLTPDTLGLRPDLSVVASCFSVDLSTLSTLGAGAVLDGNIDPADYTGGAPLLTQSCPTSGGDQVQLADSQTPVQEGSELNALYADHDDDYLYLGMTGNLAADNKSINLFIDTDANAGGGGAVIEDFSDVEFFALNDQWANATVTTDGDTVRIESTDFGSGVIDISPNANAGSAASMLEVTYTVNAPNQAPRFGIILSDADGTESVYLFEITGPGTFTDAIPVDMPSLNGLPGSVPGLDLTDISFIQLTGGFSSGDPGVAFDVTFDHVALVDGDDGEHTLNFTPDASAFPVVPISDFDLLPVDTYVSWATATITLVPDGLRIEENTTGGFGGGAVDISPNVNLSDAINFELDVTLGPSTVGPGGSAGGTILIVLADTDDTQLRWAFFNVPPGSFTLTANLSAGNLVNAGGIPGFDFANVSFMQLQADYDVLDLTWEELRANAVLPGVRPIIGFNGNQLPNGPLDILNSGTFLSDRSAEYDYAYGINLTYDPSPTAYIDYFDVVNDTFAFRGRSDLDGGSAILTGVDAVNPNNLQMAFNNQNIDGITSCTDDSFMCFTDDAATVAAQADTADSGVELAIPLADLGLSAADFPRVVQLSAIIGDRTGPASNQSLPSMRNSSVDGNQVVNPGEAPVNFTDPLSGPAAGAVISDFSSFTPTGQYGTWDPSDFTSGPDAFTVAATDFGGCFFIFPSAIDASGAAEIVLDVTVNPSNLADRIIAILYDGDGTIRVWDFDIPGPGTWTLSKELGDFLQEDAPGSVPGLDVSNLTQFNIAGTFANGNPGVIFDVTFDNYQLMGGVRNFESRAARICLGTVDGDGDCDGDNDLIDIALLQQCGGRTPNPVFPMECEQLDLFKDGTIDDADLSAFESLIDGPGN